MPARGRSAGEPAILRKPNGRRRPSPKYRATSPMSILLLVILLLLIAVNGFFVAGEFAVVRSRRARLEQLRDDGVRGASRALDQLDRVDEFVATSQVGITLASLAVGFLGEHPLAELLEPI